MPQPTQSDVHVDVPLTNLSVAYLQDMREFVASRVFPNVPVQQLSNKYYTYNKDDWFRIEAKRRAISSESAGSGYELDTANYFAEVFAIHKDIDDQIRANADSQFSLDREATEWVTRQLLMQRESDFVARYFADSVWGTDLDGVAGAPSGATQFRQWNDVASTPIEDLRRKITDVQQATGYRPNTLLLGPQVADAIFDHPDLLDRIKYTQFGSVGIDSLARVLDIDRVFIGRGTRETANDGAVSAMSYFFGKSALLVYAAPSPSLLQPSGGYTFSWVGYTGAAAEGNRINRYRIDLKRSDRIEGEMAYDMKLVAADLGVFFKTVVA